MANQQRMHLNTIDRSQIKWEANVDENFSVMASIWTDKPIPMNPQVDASYPNASDWPYCLMIVTNPSVTNPSTLGGTVGGHFIWCSMAPDNGSTFNWYPFHTGNGATAITNAGATPGASASPADLGQRLDISSYTSPNPVSTEWDHAVQSQFDQHRFIHFTMLPIPAFETINDLPAATSWPESIAFIKDRQAALPSPRDAIAISFNQGGGYLWWKLLDSTSHFVTPSGVGARAPIVPVAINTAAVNWGDRIEANFTLFRQLFDNTRPLPLPVRTQAQINASYNTAAWNWSLCYISDSQSLLRTGLPRPEECFCFRNGNANQWWSVTPVQANKIAVV